MKHANLRKMGASQRHGLGIGSGLALAARLDLRDNQTVVLLGDGECYEGSTWEAALFAAHMELNNLVAVVDWNGQFVNDFTENVNRLDSLNEKWTAFGWEVREINGHDFGEIFEALRDFRNRKSMKPASCYWKRNEPHNLWSNTGSRYKSLTYTLPLILIIK